jgi:hypothetical protein
VKRLRLPLMGADRRGGLPARQVRLPEVPLERCGVALRATRATAVARDVRLRATRVTAVARDVRARVTRVTAAARGARARATRMMAVARGAQLRVPAMAALRPARAPPPSVQSMLSFRTASGPKWMSLLLFATRWVTVRTAMAGPLLRLAPTPAIRLLTVRAPAPIA